jgi:hypothetical protein
MRVLRAGVLVLAALALAASAAAQGVRRTVTVVTATPIFVTPNSTQVPLRVAQRGAVLGLLEMNGDWCHVEFEDLQFGRRVGYIQTKDVRVNAPAPAGSVPAPAAGEQPPPARPAGQQPAVAARPLAPVLPQRGDIAAGYVFVREDGLSFPMGVAGSAAWHLHPILEVVGEAQYARGTSDLVTPGGDVTVWTALAGARVWSGERYGGGVRAFVQGLAGVLTKKGTALTGSESASGFALQPGFGAEIQASPRVAVRPEFDILFGRIEGERTTDMRFGLNVVFRWLR